MLKKLLLALLILIGALAAILLTAYRSVENTIARPLNAADTRTVPFTIESGEGVAEIAAGLQEAGLIAGSDFFKAYLWQSGQGSGLKAGAYQLSPAMSIPQIVTIFTGGGAGLKSNEAQVVIAEGFSDRQILAALKQAGAVSDAVDFNELTLSTDDYAFLTDRPAGAGLEGYLFPDTYHFFKDSSLADVTEIMLENFDAKVTPQLREEISRQGKSLFEILVMASIIERESPDKEDMPDIAGVFYNRLEIGMPLQSDATINYITDGGRPMPTSEDLAVDSPFNTYKYAGLPPAPICNPGLEAIKAAIWPKENDYLYFLMPQDGSDTTVFSKSYEEHLRNKALYLK